MYSNERKNGFSVADLLVKIIFAAIFIFILVWLFQKKIPNINMNPFYSNVFRENIKYMQEAGESYFTTDKLPTTVGESVKLTLSEMESMNLVLPFVDKDGNSCDKNSSYVSITKLDNNKGYELKTNLVCDKESNYTVKTLGCHVYCPNNGVKCDCNCNGKDNTKSCSYEKVKQYQFKKLVNGTKTTYKCDKDSKLKGKYCYKFEIEDTKSANVKKTQSKTLTQDAQLVKTDAKYEQLTTKVTTTKKQLTTTVLNPVRELTVVKKTTPSGTKTETYTCQKTRTVQKCETKNRTETYTCPKTRTVQKCETKNRTETYTCQKTRTVQKCEDKVRTETYTCQKTKVEKQCNPTTKREPYSCNCKTTIINGKSTTNCDTCYKTVTVQNCKDVTVTYNDNCTKNVTYKDCKNVTETYNDTCTRTVPYQECKNVTETYNDTCTRTVTVPGGTTYSCPSGTDYSVGTGANLRCFQYYKTYECPKGTDVKEGSGANLKCYQNVKSYSCPSGTDYKEGSGANLKCYRIISGSAYYKCKDSSYTLSGSKCYKVVKETVTVKECPKGYKLEGDKCNLYKETKTKADVKNTSSSYYEYKWSTSKTISGWTSTGKTRTVNGKKVCK